MNTSNFLTEEQIQRLILCFVNSREDMGEKEGVSDEDIHEFLNECIQRIVMGKMVELAADGLLMIAWDKGDDKFFFRETEKGKELVKEKILLEMLENIDGQNQK